MRDIASIRGELKALLPLLQKLKEDAISDNGKARYVRQLMETQYISRKTAYRLMSTDLNDLRVSDLIKLCETLECIGP